MTKELKISVGGYSSAGVKVVNQDAFAVKTAQGATLKHKGAVAAIADGVSSSERSQEASQIAVTQFISDYYATPDTWSVTQSAVRVITALNSWLYNQNRNLHQDALVATFSSIIFKSCSAYLFHVGDSRVYRNEGKRWRALTRDHVHPTREQDILTRAMGIDSHLEVDYQKVELHEGDLFFLTTDGFHNFVSYKEVNKALEEHENLEECATALCNLALTNGSDDNLSCVIVRVDEIPEEDINEAHKQVTSLAIPPVLSVGQVLEGYKVCRVLFSGTRSHVYLVEDKDGKQFVLKTPSDYYNDDATYLDGFLREEWIGKRLNHSHIMRVFPRGENSRFMYHLCEFLDGQNLRQWMIDNPQPSVDQVRKIIVEVCKGLRHFQRNGMLHRDIKPENVIIDRFGQIKIIDFGTVRVEGLEEIKSPIAEDIPVGSVDYIAPELLVERKKHHTGDFRSDMFSLAVMMYEMLCGKLPYKLENLRNNIPDSYTPWSYKELSVYRDDIPKWLDLAIEKACSPQPSQRQQAFSEFIADIQKPNISLVSKHEHMPLMQRDPLAFWKTTSFVLVLCNIVLAVLAFGLD
ncbi:serine/threonine protein kinase [Saccharobesus litoralis]|uniref:Serine/threonine protein kinase n=1 Tax=Saccharobesus litoralis TaxID=2172099 RepID=A0A2S0VVX1_9ALTE|nr:bifunctional protein-serine/threonine kinase/phosphatase [Saccharobesus litoralis]AWB68322.1 serine/threonine protein kinase [Saccharobesus litoralis]